MSSFLRTPSRVAPIAVVATLVLAACGSGGGASPSATATAGASHGHAAGPSAGGAATHGDHHGGTEHPYPSGTPTAEQQAAADALVRATLEGVEPFDDIDVARGQGYEQAMPYAFGEIRAAHYLSVEALTDRTTLDPERPEGLIYLRTPDGADVFIGVMYIAMGGPAPDIAGPLTPWYRHPELCMSGFSIVPLTAAGECTRPGTPIVQEMIHVWAVPNPLGPFAHVLPADAAGEAAGLPTSDVAPVPFVDEALLRTAVSATLGLDKGEIRQRFDAGESIAEIAAAEGVSADDLAGALADVYTAELDAAVADEEATELLALAATRFLDQQVPLLLEAHQGDPGTAATDVTEFGYPCVDIGCLVE